MKKFLVVAALFLACSSFAAEPDPLVGADAKTLLENLQKKMSSLRSVYLEFTQERHLKLFSEPLKSEGLMLIEQPEQIRWETTAPFQSILLANRKSVAQFENTDGKWKKLKLGFPQMLRRVMEQMVQMHQGNLSAMTGDYDISVSTNTAAVMLKFVPKDDSVRSFLSSLEVKVQPDFSAMQTVVMNEPGGDFTKLIFQREVRNAKFPPDTFDQTKPLDAASIKAAVNK
ncbi:MAG: outer membrane lipoprotein carrier protein LolA [Verrucomicrobiota bacterium]